jgi:ParB family transcriptional regulator, chromosome partitioning protein
VKPTKAPTIRLWPPGRVLPDERNARTHSADQIEEIAASIRQFGWTMPILVDEKGKILAGHARLEAAKLLKLEAVPVLEKTDLTEPQKRAYLLADNRLALNAGWDLGLLAVEIKALAGLDFDLTVIGFSDKELDRLLGDVAEEAVPEAEPESRQRAVIRVTCLQLDVDNVLETMRDAVAARGIRGVEITRA